MYQVTFSEQAMQELNKLETLAQLEVVEPISSVKASDLEHPREPLGRFQRHGKPFYRLRAVEHPPMAHLLRMAQQALGILPPVAARLIRVGDLRMGAVRGEAGAEVLAEADLAAGVEPSGTWLFLSHRRRRR